MGRTTRSASRSPTKLVNPPSPVSPASTIIRIANSTSKNGSDASMTPPPMPRKRGRPPKVRKGLSPPPPKKESPVTPKRLARVQAVPAGVGRPRKDDKIKNKNKMVSAQMVVEEDREKIIRKDNENGIQVTTVAPALPATTNQNLSSSPSEAVNGGGKDKRFHCPYCQQAFARKYDMEKHSRKHTGDKPYKCGVCGRQFVQVGSLAVHMRAHTGEMPYKCDVCSKGFAVKERLRLHQRTHTGERPYQCQHCDKSFARGGQLMVHRRTHTGDKPYACNSCSLRFTSSGNLKTHMKLHVGTREFQCHLCDKAYPRADTLKRHILSFHENKRLYKCDVCQKSFKGHIRDHMRTHAEDKEEKPFGCTQCGARFNQRSQLTVHMRVHTGERPYSCKICARSFSHSTALKLHLRMHTGEKPHVCKLCKKAFAQLPHLKKHMLCVHNTDKPYYCERCSAFFKVKNEYQEHVEMTHPDDIPEDLKGVALPPSDSHPSEVTTSSIKVQKTPTKVRSSRENGDDNVTPSASTKGPATSSSSSSSSMPMEKMRTLLALLLKKISTPGRLKKLGFGTRLIDDVLVESIQASGRTPMRAGEGSTDGEEVQALSANIQILLEWTIPEEYMEYFKQEKKTTTEILEELAA